ncbi:MCE family protein [Mycobacterium sp. Y57]|uniref:MCE family protein n=1 Tax=Mycolicibacterium xanthum TaxID=2796469 RepID=UPI001C85CE56|nr:MCE family protein [Mycolicibacterium xanthum]MBX7433444.1 MCE family protein [Mycolicibacterium xanthum]
MTRSARIFLGLALAVILVAGVVVLLRTTESINRTHVVAYFENSNGIYAGDDISIVGVPVGKIESIEPQPMSVKISFWYDSKYDVPADAKAAILSPTLVTARTIQLTPAYTGGPVMEDDAVIPRERTAVPVEWDQVRQQLAVLADTLQPTEPGGVSPLGSAINTTADNLRGEGANIRDAVIKLSQAVSALGDRSTNIFSTVKNLAILVSALQDSTDVMRQLNQNLASVTGLLADDPGEVAGAVRDLDRVVGEVQTFVAENRESLGTTSDKLAGVTQALTDSLGDVKQFLHVAPNTLQNYVNIWQPAQGAISSVPMINNFADPISFLCGAVQAASRLGAEESAKLCVQYLAPIIKNRQYNFLPLANNVFVGASTRPNELTYSEDWLRPDYIPPQPVPSAGPQPAPSAGPPPAAGAPLPPSTGPLLPAEAMPPAVPPATPNPADGLQGLMVPAGPTGEPGSVGP